MQFSLHFCWNGIEDTYATLIFWVHSGKNILRGKKELISGAKMSIFGKKTAPFSQCLEIVFSGVQDDIFGS